MLMPDEGDSPNICEKLFLDTFLRAADLNMDAENDDINATDVNTYSR